MKSLKILQIIIIFVNSLSAMGNCIKTPESNSININSKKILSDIPRDNKVDIFLFLTNEIRWNSWNYRFIKT